MIANIRNWLNRPYYTPVFSTYNFIVSFLFGLIVSIFLIVFKPFELYLLGDYLVLYSIVYGFISTFTLIIILFFLPRVILKNYFNAKTRTILKQIILLNISVIAISTFSYPFVVYTEKSTNQEISGYFTILMYSYAIGIFPIIFWVYFDGLNFRKKTKISLSNKNHFLNKEENYNKKNLIKLTSSDTKNTISLDLNSLVYIKSEGNYVSLYINNNTVLKEIVFRTTLNKITTELISYKNIIRCHKSYIINTKYIESFSGNTKGYFLKILEKNLKIPVSRKFKKEEVKNFINK